MCHARAVHVPFAAITLANADRLAAPCCALLRLVMQADLALAPTQTQVANTKHTRPPMPSHHPSAPPHFLDFIAKQAACTRYTCM